MSDQEKNRPSHRVSFAAFEEGHDGQYKLGNAREIGAIWPRKNREGQGILRFDHTPQQEGIYFIREIRASTTERGDNSKNDPERER